MFVASRAVRFALLLAGSVLPLALAQPAQADNFTASFNAAGVQASSASTFTENFSSASSGTSFTSNYGGSPITGTYTGNFNINTADVYGGAGGTGSYIATTSSYAVTFSSSINYFGLWFSALDAGNQLSFYNGSNLLYTFTPTTFLGLVGPCPSASGFCGNPNTNHPGNTSQQYAFLNFFDTNGSFNQVVFTEVAPTGALESDNQTIGNLSSTPGGTPTTTSPVPEPSSMLLLGTGALGVVGMLRRRL